MDLQERVNRLLQSVKEEGIESIAQRTELDEIDRSLIELMTSLQPAVRAAGTYTVHVTNNRNAVIDEVRLFFKRNSDDPGAAVHNTWATNVQPGQTRFFDLGPCSDLQSYAFGAWIGNQTIVSIPPPGTGPLTPARAAQDFPQNHVGPCEDRFPL